MGALGNRSERVKGTELAELLDTTAGFLPQALSPLVKRGWLVSEPGPAGGYRLGTDLAAVSVLDVVEAVDGPTDTGRCVVADRACSSASPCALHVPWSRARAELTEALRAVSLAELTNDPEPVAT